MKKRLILSPVAVLLLLAGAGHAASIGTAFTYQGRLTDGGSPATGTYDLRFGLYNAQSGGSQVGVTLTNGAAGVANGLFTATLDFGPGVFDGSAYWLEISVRTNNAGAFIPLTPRQPVAPTPYAITAGAVSGIVPAAQVSGQLSGTQIGAGAVGAANVDNTQVQLRVTGTAPAGQFITGIAANGSVTVGSDTTDWKLNGNGGTTPGANFIGTTDNQPLEFRAGNQRALRLEFGGTASPNVIGGSSLNLVSNGVVSATIAGGGESVSIFGSTLLYPNVIGGNLGAIGGGALNTIGTNHAATIGGGYNNSAMALESTIGGGGGNRIEAAASFATIGGGASNTNGGSYATIAGGQLNTATGDYSFAAGRRAKANHPGAFVWGDATDSDFASSAGNQFLVRASGGVGINTNNPSGAALSVVGGIRAGANGTIQSRVQFGTATVGTGTNGVNTFTISFPAAFTAAPKVFVTTRGNDNPDTFAISTRAVTPSNFKVNILRMDVAAGWGQALQVDWYAVE